MFAHVLLRSCSLMFCFAHVLLRSCSNHTINFATNSVTNSATISAHWPPFLLRNSCSISRACLRKNVQKIYSILIPTPHTQPTWHSWLTPATGDTFLFSYNQIPIILNEEEFLQHNMLLKLPGQISPSQIWGPKWCLSCGYFSLCRRHVMFEDVSGCHINLESAHS